MLKFAVVLVIIGFVCAENHHPPHHPHPDGNKACTDDTDCAGCDLNMAGTCVSGTCYCNAMVKRAVCHNSHDCSCPPGQNGVCNSQSQCECGDHVVG